MNYSTPGATASATATVCDNLATFGGAPERDELDSRPIWDVDCHHSSDHALAGSHSKTAAEIFASSMAAGVIQEIMDLAAEHLTSDGTQLSDEREPLLWGFVNVLHAQMQRLDRTVDRLTPEMRDLQEAQDGTEIKANELELLTDRAQNLGDRRDAFELMRDEAADAYQHITTNLWRPRHGSHTLADARQYPGQDRGPRLSEGSQEPRDRRPTCRTARSSRSPAARPSPTRTPSGPRSTRSARSTPTWCWCTATAPGVEKIAARWAEARGVAQVVCRPNWNAYGKAAPFRRNDDIINLLPKGLIAFPGSGITANLVDKGAAARGRHPRHGHRRLTSTLHRHHREPATALARTGSPLFLRATTDKQKQAREARSRGSAPRAKPRTTVTRSRATALASAPYPQAGPRGRQQPVRPGRPSARHPARSPRGAVTPRGETSLARYNNNHRATRIATARACATAPACGLA